MGRGKVELRRIDNDVSRQVTFGKRRAGLLHCNGQPFDYCSPNTCWSELIQRYVSITDAELQGTDHDDDDDDDDDQVQQMFTEIVALRRERDLLEASLRRQTGEDLPSGVTEEELDTLDQQLDSVLAKVREMKEKLLNQQLDESQEKVNILDDQNYFLRHMTKERHRAAAEAVALAAEGMATPALPFGGFFPEVEEGLSTPLQLWPQQPHDVQGFGLQPSLRLWLWRR